MKKLPLVTLLILFSAPVMAYVGPGLGMGVIGTILGVLTVIMLAVFGLFWYPLKRALNKKKTASINSGNLHSDTRSAQSDKMVEHHPDNQISGHPETFNPATDPATVKRIDSQVQ